MKFRLKGWQAWLLSTVPLIIMIYLGLILMHIRSPTNVFQGLAGAALVGIGIGGIIGGFGYYYDEMKRESISLPKVRVKQIRPSRRNRYLDSIAKSMAKRGTASSEILKAGISTTPHAFYYKWTYYSVLALIAAVPAAFILAFALKSPLPLLMIAAPFIVFFVLPGLSLRSAEGDRKRAIDDELPFFTLYMAALADVGVSLYDGMKRLIGQGVFRWIESDAAYLQRAVEFIGVDQLTAIDQMARVHPSKNMQELLYGYSSELRSGGDIASYFTNRAQELLRWLEFRYEKYGDSVSDLGEMMVAMFFILPTIVIATAFISPSVSITLVWLMSVLIIPVVGIMMVFIIRSAQPKTGDTYKGNDAFAAIAVAVTGILMFFARLPLYSIAAGAAVSGTIAYGAPVFMQKRMSGDEERSLEDFVRDVTEYRKSGYDMTRAIIRIASENSYTPAFTHLIKSVAAALSLGERLSEVNVRANSWLVKQVFFLFGQMNDSGGGSPKELEFVHDFVVRYTLSKRMVKGRMKVYEMLTLGTPVGLAFLIFIMATFLTYFRGSIAGIPGGAAGLSFINTSIPPSLFTAAYLMVIDSAVFMGLSAGVASDFTAKNTWRIALAALLAALAIFVLTDFGTAITGLMPSNLFSLQLFLPFVIELP